MEFSKTIVEHSFDIVKLLIPVLLFFLGLYFSVVLSNYHEAKRLEKLKVYFESLLEIHMKISLEQAYNYKVAADNLKIIGNTNLMIEGVTGTPHESINAIDRQDLYKIYVSDEKIVEDTEKFNKIVTGVEYLNAVSLEVKSNNAKTRERKLKLTSDWNENNDLVNTEIYKLELQKKSGMLDDKKHLQEVIDIWRAKMPEPSLSNMYEAKVTNMIKKLKSNELDDNTVVLLGYLNNLKFTYEQISEFQKHGSNSYEQTYNTTLTVVNVIRNALK